MFAGFVWQKFLQATGLLISGRPFPRIQFPVRQKGQLRHETVHIYRVWYVLLRVYFYWILELINLLQIHTSRKPKKHSWTQDREETSQHWTQNYRMCRELWSKILMTSCSEELCSLVSNRQLDKIKILFVNWHLQSWIARLKICPWCRSSTRRTLPTWTQSLSTLKQLPVP